MPKPPSSARRASKAEHADATLATTAMAWRSTVPVRVAGAIAKLADQPPLIVASAMTLGAGVVLRQPRLVRAGLRMLANELVATGMKSVVKARLDRSRPARMVKDGRYRRRTRSPDGDSDGAYSSFPSGHTAGAVAVGRALAREFPGAAPVITAVAGLVALVQVPRGAHFPIDVAAGAVIGAAADLAVGGAIRIAAGVDRAPDRGAVRPVRP